MSNALRAVAKMPRRIPSTKISHESSLALTPCSFACNNRGHSYIYLLYYGERKTRARRYPNEVARAALATSFSHSKRMHANARALANASRQMVNVSLARCSFIHANQKTGTSGRRCAFPAPRATDCCCWVWSENGREEAPTENIIHMRVKLIHKRKKMKLPVCLNHSGSTTTKSCLMKIVATARSFLLKCLAWYGLG